MKSSVVFTGLAVAALAAGSSAAVSAGAGGGHRDHDEKVCVVLPASDDFFSELSPADQMQRALRRAERSLGVDGETLQPTTNDDVPAALDEFLQAGDCDMIVGDFFVGAVMEPLLADYPDQRFVQLDNIAFAGDPPNARSVDFATEQPSFMAGYLAAALTNTGKVGVFGGVQVPGVTVFMDAFALGIQHYNAVTGAGVELLGWDVETETGLFAGTFSDPEIGRQLTNQLYEQGADIVFPLAGILQLGSLEAANARAAAGDDVKVIGVDLDLFKAVGGDPNRVILTSVTNNYFLALYRQVEDLVTDRWEPGVTVEDLESGGVDLARWHHMNREVPGWLRQDLREIERAIERGEIVTTIDRSFNFWEQLNFQFGPGRLSRNPDSLNEYLKFRQAIAHAIDKDRIVAEIPHADRPIDSYVEAFLPALSQGAWAQYDYDPAASIQLLSELCAELSRDCSSNPPRAVFTTTSTDARVQIAGLLDEMLSDVGILFEIQLEEAWVFFQGPDGDNATNDGTIGDGTFDLSLWAQDGTPALDDLVAIHDMFDPEGLPPLDSYYNYYRWGTPDSSVIDANTTRFAELRDLMNSTSDEAQIVGYIHEAEQILADQVVIIPLYIRAP